VEKGIYIERGKRSVLGWAEEGKEYGHGVRWRRGLSISFIFEIVARASSISLISVLTHRFMSYLIIYLIVNQLIYPASRRSSPVIHHSAILHVRFSLLITYGILLLTRSETPVHTRKLNHQLSQMINH
jgi:hypothetical protein